MVYRIIGWIFATLGFLLIVGNMIVHDAGAFDGENAWGATANAVAKLPSLIAEIGFVLIGMSILIVGELRAILAAMREPTPGVSGYQPDQPRQSAVAAPKRSARAVRPSAPTSPGVEMSPEEARAIEDEEIRRFREGSRR